MIIMDIFLEIESSLYFFHQVRKIDCDSKAFLKATNGGHHVLIQ